MATITEHLEVLLDGRDLTFEQAKALQDTIFEGEVSEVQIAAFLAMMRMKRAASAEIAGLARSLRNHAVPVKVGIDNLVDTLRKHNRPLPAADLLLTDPYEALMQNVADVKDLGSGVIGGVECDYLAFRAKEVDWQIWIAQGERPYPCRYVINSKSIDGEPQYSIQVGDWKTGDEVAAADFSFTPPADAKKVDLKDLEGTEELPDHFQIGEAQ